MNTVKFLVTEWSLQMTHEFQTGALVNARGREWIVLPESTQEVLMIRPIGGLEEEVVGISTNTAETIESATFALPDWENPGDFNSCRLLRDAARIATRNAAGPFRSFGKIAVEPRPYQMVPLLMALRLDPVRLLIADDVGIGKTIEASLIAKELLERGEITTMAILCPPQLAEQWQKELSQKFHIEAELVLSSTIKRLERGLRPGESVFERHKVVIISTDFIKSDAHRDDFLRECPELVIVDEAHGCTLSGKGGTGRQQRFELIKKISERDDQHLILVTATPHSGNENAFRSLLSLLDAKFADLPLDLERDEKSGIRAELAKHLVQRLRADVISMDLEMGTQTAFPAREDAEDSYSLNSDYKALFNKILGFANELISDTGEKRHRRVRWWSALGLLRATASSPAAAAATLRKRSMPTEAISLDEIDEMGMNAILDRDEADMSQVVDLTLGADVAGKDDDATHQRLRRLAKEAVSLHGEKDEKLQKLIKIVKKMLRDGYQPIVFCKFIDTSDYVALHLREAIKKAEVYSITGLIPPREREDRIKELESHPTRVLVCTDCLSEGINLQDGFDAVIHYDLSWNPTQHEQREGRVDRFGQASEKVRVLTYFGVDNQIDGVVLDVLLRKHKTIKSDLGISVAIPGGSEDLVKALFEGMELRGKGSDNQLFFPNMEPRKEELHARWEDAREKEKRSRTRFAQHSIKTYEIQEQLDKVRQAIGAGPTIEKFFSDVLQAVGVPVSEKGNRTYDVEISNETPRAMRHAIGLEKPFVGRFDLPVKDKVLYMSRTHPVVEGLASYALETALDDVQGHGEKTIASRCGVALTTSVAVKTTVLVVRMQYQLLVKRKGSENQPLLAEEVVLLAYEGTENTPVWLDPVKSTDLLDSRPSGNVPDALKRDQLKHLLSNFDNVQEELHQIAQERSELLAESHAGIRNSAKLGGRVNVKVILPVDVLGAYILLPGKTSGVTSDV
jgi:superfamily II DNA or RNA helicase